MVLVTGETKAGTLTLAYKALVERPSQNQQVLGVFLLKVQAYFKQAEVAALALL